MKEENNKATLFLKLDQAVKDALVKHVREERKARNRHVSITEVFTEWVKSLQTTNH